MSDSSDREGEDSENQQGRSSFLNFVSPDRDSNADSLYDDPDGVDQSPNYEPFDEEEEEDDNDDDDEEEKEEPNHRPSADDTTIPSNDFAPAYDSAFLAELAESQSLPHPLARHFAHLNCFQLTHPNLRAPTSVVELKQHAQAVCLLLTLLQPSKSTTGWPYVAADPPFPAQFDFLTDLFDPYPGARFSNAGINARHYVPLPALNNRLESGHGGIDNIERWTRPELLAMANKLLTRLDHVYRSTGGILGIPPPPPPRPWIDEAARPAGLAKNSILAQWLSFTRALTLRLASLEKETVALRGALGHRAQVAGERMKQSREKTAKGEGSGERELVFSQDRYVLAGLSDGLWDRLNEELTVREGENREERKHEREEREQGRGVQARGWGDFSGEDEDDDDAGETNVVTWIETTSRLYRVRGHDSIFVIPGFGLHPGAATVHRVERTPLVQAVPVRGATAAEKNGDDDEDDDVGEVDGWAQTAWERERDVRIRELEATAARLARELETERKGRGRKRR